MASNTIDLAELSQALEYAAAQHQTQHRAGYKPLPYINHLIKVTNLLIRVGEERGRDLLLAAVLHDSVEDTDTTEEYLAATYGDAVAAIVAEVTDDMSLPYDERKQRQITTASSLSEPARKIRIADKASNLQDIFNYPLDWSKSKKMAYLENAIQVVEQIRGTHPALEAHFDRVVEDINRQLGNEE